MNIMNTGIYAIRNTTNGKRYVGSATFLLKRITGHKRKLINGSHQNPKLQAAWNKYGSDSFIFEKLIVCSKQDLLMYEQIAIDGYDAVKNGYNIRLKAESNIGIKMPPSHGAKVSAAQKGRITSSEHRANLSLAFKGRVISPEWRAKLSAVNTGKILPSETKAKISASLKGITHSPESIAKQVATRLENNAKKILAGIPVHSLESIAKQKATKAITRAAREAAKLAAKATQ